MTFWKLTLSYDGTAFHGWQVQPGLPTVQGTLATMLKQITGESVLPQGSGRTDAGVHALGQVASFALEAPIPAANLLRALNRKLPQSIRILRAEVVEESFHARHSAARKTYDYRIFERRRICERRIGERRVNGERKEDDPDGACIERICSPIAAPFVWDCRWPLRIEPMQEAAAMLCGTHDFTSFAASDPERALRAPEMSMRDAGDAGLNPVKTIFASTVTREDGLLRYRVEGSGFLHHMVRNIVGTLVDVGRGSLRPEDVERILAARDRAAAGPTAPAQGLFLVSVAYGEPGGQP